MKVCFIGHREIEKSEQLIYLLKETVKALINKGIKTFLFGSMSEFNNLAWEVVTKLKEEYSFIKRVYVRSTFQHINKPYEEYLLKDYEETYFPAKIEKAGRYSYVERNYDMIDNSICCVFYYNENYVSSTKTKSKQILFGSKKGGSGTKVAYEYAKKRNKEIINLYRE